MLVCLPCGLPGVVIAHTLTHTHTHSQQSSEAALNGTFCLLSSGTLAHTHTLTLAHWGRLPFHTLNASFSAECAKLLKAKHGTAHNIHTHTQTEAHTHTHAVIHTHTHTHKLAQFIKCCACKMAATNAAASFVIFVRRQPPKVCSIISYYDSSSSVPERVCVSASVCVCQVALSLA